MEAAVVSADTETVHALIINGFPTNRRLQSPGGNTALHLATRQQSLDIIVELLYHGADPLAKNDLNVTPVSIATKHRSAECLELLIAHAQRMLDVGTLWLQFDGSLSLWKDSNNEVLGTLIRCTPDLTAVRSNVHSNLLYLLRTRQMYDGLQLFVAVGNALSTEQQSKLDPVRDKPFLDWLKDYRCAVQPLTHYCRLAIRRRLQGQCNVFYGTRHLPLPKSIQDFICFRAGRCQKPRLNNSNKSVSDGKWHS